MKAEYRKGCPQRDSAEFGIRECRERGGAIDLLEQILDRDNLNRAYKQVKRNHGAPGIDGMTVEDALPWLQEHREELLQSIRDSRYKPSPVRRKEIPKPDGSGVRKLGIPTVIDRVIQQAIAQQLQPLFEPLFSEGATATAQDEARSKRMATKAATDVHLERVEEAENKGTKLAKAWSA